jgi:hypothetical protein
MAISLVGHTGILGSATTTAIDTTGSTLLVVISYYWSSITGTVTDSKGNTWNNLTQYGTSDSTGLCQIHYSYNKGGSALSVGTNHTFTISSQAYQCLHAIAFSGTLTDSSVYLSGSDHGNLGNDPIKPGSVTPSAAGDLILTGWSGGGGTTTAQSIDSGLSALDFLHNSSDMDICQAYLITTGTGAIDPTWTLTGGSNFATSIAVFVAATGGGGGTVIPILMQSYRRRN